MGKTRLKIEEVKRRLFEAHGDSVSIDESTYVDMNSYCTFIHKIYGSWKAFPRGVTRGSTHFKAATEDKKCPIEEIKNRIKEIHGDLVVLDESTYVNVDTPCVFINRKYGEWKATPASILSGASSSFEGRAKEAIMTIEELKSKIFAVHGDQVIVDESTFVKTHEKCTFIDKDYGSWEAFPTNVLRGCGHKVRARIKAMATTLARYGVENISQNREKALQAAKTGNNTCVKLHWKTGEELICKASYEPKVVDYLNTNRIDFLWQPQVFITPILTLKGNISTYRPDLFLINENKWVEIKGYMRPCSQLKWDWFKTQFPDAELWDREKLKEMSIL